MVDFIVEDKTPFSIWNKPQLVEQYLFDTDDHRYVHVIPPYEATFPALYLIREHIRMRTYAKKARSSLCENDEKQFCKYDCDKEYCSKIEDIASPRVTIEVMHETERQRHTEYHGRNEEQPNPRRSSQPSL